MPVFSWPTALAAFLASLVEFAEALTIVLAVRAVRGWRPAFAGAGAAAVLLTALVAVFGPHLARLDAHLFQLTVGVLLTLFGLRWLRKAVLRASGVIALHNEDSEYAETEAVLRRGRTGAGFDSGAALTAFNGVFIEGIEVVFIVLSLGAVSRQIWPAAFGAGAAALLVVLLGLIARSPLSQVPENALKLMVGALVSAFGTLWIGEGLQLSWPGGVWTPLLLTAGYLGVAGLGTVLAKSLGRGRQE